MFVCLDKIDIKKQPSSVGQSAKLITWRSMVQIHPLLFIFEFNFINWAKPSHIVIFSKIFKNIFSNFSKNRSRVSSNMSPMFFNNLYIYLKQAWAHLMSIYLIFILLMYLFV